MRIRFSQLQHPPAQSRRQQPVQPSGLDTVSIQAARGKHRVISPKQRALLDKLFPVDILVQTVIEELSPEQSVANDHTGLSAQQEKALIPRLIWILRANDDRYQLAEALRTVLDPDTINHLLDEAVSLSRAEPNEIRPVIHFEPPKGEFGNPTYVLLAKWLLKSLDRITEEQGQSHRKPEETIQHLLPYLDLTRDTILHYLQTVYGIQISPSTWTHARKLIGLVRPELYKREQKYNVAGSNHFSHTSGDQEALNAIYRVVKTRIRLGLLGDIDRRLSCRDLMPEQRMNIDITERNQLAILRALELEGYLLPDAVHTNARILSKRPPPEPPDQVLLTSYQQFSVLQAELAGQPPTPDKIEQYENLKQALISAHVLLDDTPPEQQAIKAMLEYIATQLDSGKLKAGERIPNQATLSRLITSLNSTQLELAIQQLASPKMQVLLPQEDTYTILLRDPRQPVNPDALQKVLEAYGYLEFPQAGQPISGLEKAVIRILACLEREFERQTITLENPFGLKKLLEQNHIDSYKEDAIRFLNRQNILRSGLGKPSLLISDPTTVNKRQLIQRLREELASVPKE